MGQPTQNPLYVERDGCRSPENYNASNVGSDILANYENRLQDSNERGFEETSLSSSDCKQYLCDYKRAWKDFRRVWFLVLACLSFFCVVALFDFRYRGTLHGLLAQDTSAPSRVNKENQQGQRTVTTTTTNQDYPTREEETYVERLVSRYGIGVVIILFFGYMIWTAQGQLLPLYIKRREKELELMDKQKDVLITVASAQTAAASTLAKIGERVDQVMDEAKTANGKLDRVHDKLDDCIDDKRRQN